MSGDGSGIFEQITGAAVRHGTAGFFRGLLGAIAALVLLAYTGATPDAVRIYVQVALTAFFLLSLVVAAYAMIGGRGGPAITRKSDRSEPAALPDLSADMNEDFLERLAETLRRRRDHDPRE